MHVIQSICDRVAVIHQGGIVEQGPVTEVFLKPKHEVTQEFIRQRWTAAKRPVGHSGQANGPSRGQITFLGSKTYESILSHTVHETGVNFAILQGTISTIKETPYGQLIVRFEGAEGAIEDTIRKLLEQGLDVEVIH